MLLAKGRYASPRPLLNSLVILIFIHYGVSVEYYDRHQKTVMEILLGAMEKIVPNILTDLTNVRMTMRAISEKSDASGQLSLRQVNRVLLDSIRWGKMTEAERARIIALTCDPVVEVFLKEYDVGDFLTS